MIKVYCLCMLGSGIIENLRKTLLMNGAVLCIQICTCMLGSILTLQCHVHTPTIRFLMVLN